MLAKNTLVAAALRYARLGWFVVSVNSVRGRRCTCDNHKCNRPGKHPLTRHGVNDATNDYDVIRRWWAEWPLANVAIATGWQSGILVIDVDPRNNGVHSLNAAEANYGSLRDTTTAITGGGGRHFIYVHPRFAVEKHALGPGIDIISDGQYIVAPPSLHISGRTYSWRVGYDPDSKPPQILPDAYQNILQIGSKDRADKTNAVAPGVTFK